MATLPLFPRDRVKSLDHLAVSGKLALFFVLAVLLFVAAEAAVIDIVLHGKNVGGACGLLEDLLNLGGFRVVAQLLVEGIVGARVVVARQCEPAFPGAAVCRLRRGCR